MKPNSNETVSKLRSRQKKIVAAVDFSHTSVVAANQALMIARMRGSELVLLYVLESNGGISDLFRSKESQEKHRVTAEEKLAELESKLAVKDVRVSKMVVEGKPHRAIVEAADSILAEMIVMGTSGRETGDHNYIGSNVYSIVRLANCPVVSLNHNSNPKSISKVLVPVDPQFGIRELRVLMEIYSESWNGEIVLLSFAKPGSGDHTELKNYLARQQEALANHGVTKVSSMVIEAKEISKGIVEVLTSGNFDMVWIETHGRSGLLNLIEGSVTEELLFYSPVPVLSLKPVREAAHDYFYHETFPI